MGVRGQFADIRFLFLPRGSWSLNSGEQACQQAPSPTEPPRRIPSTSLLTCMCMLWHTCTCACFHMYCHSCTHACSRMCSYSCMLWHTCTHVGSHVHFPSSILWHTSTSACFHMCAHTYGGNMLVPYVLSFMHALTHMHTCLLSCALL